MDIASELAGSVTLGFILGVATGYALKKVLKFLLFVLGVVILGIQILAYFDVIKVTWNGVKFSLPVSADKVFQITLYNIPLTGGFLIGFWLGFKKG